MPDAAAAGHSSESPPHDRYRELGRRLAAVEAPADGARAVLDFAMRLTGAELGAIVLTEGGERRLLCRQGPLGDGEALILEDPVLAEALSLVTPVAVRDTGRRARLGGFRNGRAGRPRSVLCVPLGSAGRLLGALYLGREAPGAWGSPLRIDDLTLLASSAARFVELLRRESSTPTGAEEDLVGDSPGMQEVRRLIERVAWTDLSVLVVGETGTGKELIARAIHAGSPRAPKPLVTLNCSAVPESLLEGELFGAAKGAYTGATRDRPGHIEAAHESTLLLDEVGDMPLHMQATLLRVLEERRVVRLGETEGRDVDFRLIAATNKDLAAEVAGGRFREDLLYRIPEVTISVPPLRERGEDVLLLAHLFLRQIERALWLRPHVLSSDAEAVLGAYSWPGNVRELRAIMRRAAVLCDGVVVRASDLALPEGGERGPIEARGPPALGDLDRPLGEARDAFVSAYVQAVVTRHGGDRKEAAEALGISLRSVYRYLGPPGREAPS